MPINLPISIDSSNAHKNGFVGYDDDKIYPLIRDPSNRNSNRVKNIFKDDFTGTSVANIAKAQHKNKSELDKFGDSDIKEGRITDIDDQIVQLETARAENPNNAISITAQISELAAKKRRINENYAAGLLLDETIATVAGTEDEAGQDEAYNPDFPVETVSYTYNKDVYDASERGLGQDGVESGMRAPNVAYPNNEDNAYTQPKAGSGGFGVNPSENSNNEGLVTSLQITKRYEP